MKKLLVLLFTILLMSTMTICVFATDTKVETFDFFEWFKATFTVEKVVAFASAFVSALMTAIVTKIMKSISKDREINTIALNNAIEKGVQEQLNKYIPQVVNPVLAKIDKVEKNTNSVIKGIALLQDGTPQSKLAMYDLIGQTKIVDKSTIEMCKQDVEKEIQKTEEQKQETIKELDNIIIPQGDL